MYLKRIVFTTLITLLISCQPSGVTPPLTSQPTPTPSPTSEASLMPSQTGMAESPTPSTGESSFAPTPTPPPTTSTPSPKITATPSAAPSAEATPTPIPTSIPPLSPGNYSPIRKIAGNGKTGTTENGTTSDKLAFAAITDMVTDEENNIWFLESDTGRLTYLTKELIRPNSDNASITYRVFWVKKEGLKNPSGMVRDSEGNFYIVEKTQHRLIKIDTKGELHILAGRDGEKGYNGDGKATEVLLNAPTDVALDKNGDLYITDTGNHLLRKITPDGMLTTIAGKYTIDNKKLKETDPEPTYQPVGDTLGDGKVALQSQLDTPQQIAINQEGTIFLTSKASYIRFIKNGVIDRFAGSQSTGYNGDNIDAKLAHMNGPTYLTVGPDGLLYFVDRGNNRIRRINPDGTIKDIAGSGRKEEAIDVLGDPLKAEFLPGPITSDKNGNIYLYDEEHRFLRQIERIKDSINQ